MNSRLLIPYLLFLLFALYFFQGSLYPTGSYVSRTSLILILIISGYYSIKVLKPTNKPHKFLIAWTLLLLVNILGFLITGDFSDNDHVQLFKNTLGAMLPLYPFYYFSRFYYLSDKDLVKFFFIITPVTIVSFMTNNPEILSSGTIGAGDVVNNLAYAFVNLMTFVFLFKQRRLLSVLLMAILMIFIVQGAKRGAILGGFIGLIMFLILQLKTIDKQKPIREYLVVFFFTLILGVLAYQVLVNNEYAVERISSFSEGNFSKRDAIYETVLTKWYSSNNFHNLMFGYGFAASLKITGGSFAHNDWLELLSAFGIMGILIYGVLFYFVIKEIRDHDREKNESILLITIVILWAFTSLVSMWYTSMGVYNQAMLLGYLIGKRERLLMTEYQ